MNLANKITIFRVMLIPAFVICYMITGISVYSALIFIFAALTDTLDGHLARSQNLVTTFGQFLDPLADKMLAMAALVMLVSTGALAGWTVIIILGREFIITGFRIVAASNGVNIAAGSLGKYKTIFQFVSISLYLLSKTLDVLKIAHFFYGIAIILTMVSMIDYIWRNRQVLDLNNI